MEKVETKQSGENKDCPTLARIFNERVAKGKFDNLSPLIPDLHNCVFERKVTFSKANFIDCIDSSSVSSDSLILELVAEKTASLWFNQFNLFCVNKSLCVLSDISKAQLAKLPELKTVHKKPVFNFKMP